jgi:hypothetical protein
MMTQVHFLFTNQFIEKPTSEEFREAQKRCSAQLVLGVVVAVVAVVALPQTGVDNACTSTELLLIDI